MIRAIFLRIVPTCLALLSGACLCGHPLVGILDTICNVDQLQRMSTNLSAYNQLATDIDASTTTSFNGGLGFEPIGDSTTPFSGNFNGQYFSISKLYFNRPTTDRVGFFGQTSNAVIEGFYLTQLDIAGQGRTGGVVRHMSGGTLGEVSTTGSVTGNANETGGIAGVVVGAGAVVERVYSKATVTQNTGGLIGLVRDAAVVRDSYFAGSVNAPSATLKVAGLIGHVWNIGGCASPDTLETSYSTGSLSSADTLQAGAVGQIQGCIGANVYCLDTKDSAAQECRNDLAGGSMTGGRRTPAQLNCPTFAGETCNGIATYSAWSSSVWNFGDASQNPWLRWTGDTPP